MQKQKNYRYTKFDSKSLSAAVDAVKSLTPKEIHYDTLKVELGDATWSYDTLHELLAAADQGRADISASADGYNYRLNVMNYDFHS